jgi:hypothetical protein
MLRNSKCKEIGKLVFGKPIVDKKISKKDLVKIESVVNMVGVIAEDSRKA